MARNVSQVIVEQLGEWGIEYAFGVMGASILGLVDAIRRQDRVRFVATQNEQAAAFAASAYAKLTGMPAACIAPAGPGATSLMTGIYDAASDEVPLLAITGDVRRTWEHEKAWHEIDELALFEPVSVFNAQIETPPQAPLLVGGAVHAAMSRRGVAHLSVPIDLQMAEADIEPIPLHGHLAWTMPVAAEEGVRQATRLLSTATRPLILAGGGALGAREPLLELAHRLGAPILTTCRSKGLIPASEPLYMGIPGFGGTPLADSLMREADTILVVGCSLSQNTTGDWHLISPGQQLIQIDIDPDKIGRLFPVEVGLWGDAAATLRHLTASLPEGRPRTSWSDLTSRKLEMLALIDQKAGLRVSPIKPQFAVRALQETLPADAIIALDTGDNAFFMCQQYQPKGERFLISYHLGSTGFALPAAIAAALAFPERQTVAVVGDGGLSFSLGELITAAHYSLPITVVCFNNARLGMIDSEEEQAGMAPFFTERPAMNFAGVAQACGAQGVRVEEPGALEAALHRAMATRQPFVVDVAIDPLERQKTALEPAREVVV